MKSKIYVLIVLLLIVFSKISSGQHDEFEEFKKSYNEAILFEKEKLNNFLLAQDSAFASYLRYEWEQFNLFSEYEPKQFPGPEKIPIYENANNSKTIEKIELTEIETIEFKNPQYTIKPIAIPDSEPIVSDRDFRFININYYGLLIGLEYSEKIIPAKNYSANSNDIAEYWQFISKTEYNSLLEQLLTIKTDYNLNDWAYYLLIDNFSKSISLNDNNSCLLAWFLLTKSGYKVKIAYSGENLLLLIPFVQQVYGMKYYIFDNINYYVVNGSFKQVNTYAREYPDANRIMNLEIYQAPRFDNNIQSNNISFLWQNDTINLKINYNINLIEFYDSYPQCDLRVYFNAGISQALWQSLSEAIFDYVYNKPEDEAASFILKMVQTGFDYRTDNDQFGNERFLFPEELFHYPYSDCEDRSILFAYLVSEFLNIPVIGLTYPGHIATALNFKDYIIGDIVEYSNKQFVVCDPTYINAPIGITMPEYKSKRVKILDLKDSHQHKTQASFVWEHIYQSTRTNNEETFNMIEISDSTMLLSGFFNDSLILCNKTYKYNGFKGAFVANINTDGFCNWFFPIFASEIIQIDAVKVDSSGNFYVAGRFKGNISIEINHIIGMSAFAQQNDIAGFVLKIDNSGLPLWLTKIELPERNLYSNFYYQSVLNVEGDLIGLKQICESAFDNSETLFIDYDSQVIFTLLSLAKDEYFENHPIYNSDDEYLIVEVWQTRMNQYLDQNYNNEIAGLFALLETFAFGDIDIRGNELLNALNVLMPKFKNNNPEIYNTLTSIELLQSRMGVLSIYTQNGCNLKFGKIYITNGAKMRFRDYKSGNKQIKIINGVYYNTIFKSINVNYIKIFKVNGDLLVDYDYKHTQRVYNIKRDLIK
ncbi:MAG TPA: hypothetical protein PLO05_00510 [Bacteroidales bacterium]|nr:hypothetical protein [Bacteroidales bacterium]